MARLRSYESCPGYRSPRGRNYYTYLRTVILDNGHTAGAPATAFCYTETIRGLFRDDEFYDLDLDDGQAARWPVAGVRLILRHTTPQDFPGSHSFNRTARLRGHQI
jgi:hypothetical protein